MRAIGRSKLILILLGAFVPLRELIGGVLYQRVMEILSRSTTLGPTWSVSDAVQEVCNEATTR